MIREAKQTIRCAIYTRVSTDERLDQEFNSLDNQRESGEAYITSQQHEGWTCLPTRYDDGGFSGGSMERPALQRLLADIEAGKIDCVITYKVDRLSRSLLDFSRILEVFDRRNVAFVSVTQLFNTSNSMGRLMLNVLLSFAQFEREIISERTRDKMSAARKKGKYAGGRPVLGYDVVEKRLIVNATEGKRVCAMFDFYLEHESLMKVAAEANRRGWKTKAWTTRKGERRTGLPFDKARVHGLLTNPVYAGKVFHDGTTYAGEHEAIIDAETFDEVQRLLKRHKARSAAQRKRHASLLQGLLRCKPCGTAMCHSFTTKATRRYRYYVCSAAQKRGWDVCPSKSVPAAEIEKFVVDQIRAIGRDPGVIAATLAETQAQVTAAIAELAKERKALDRELTKASAELRRVAADVRPCADETPASARLADLNERVRHAETRAGEIAAEIERLEREAVTEAEVTGALAAFDPLWETLTTRERARVLELLIERVEYDGAEGTVSVTFRPTGIRTLVEEYQLEESAA